MRSHFDRLKSVYSFVNKSLIVSANIELVTSRRQILIIARHKKASCVNELLEIMHLLLCVILPLISPV